MRDAAKRWVGSYLEKALDWVTTHECAIRTSKVLIQNFLRGFQFFQSR